MTGRDRLPSGKPQALTASRTNRPKSPTSAPSQRRFGPMGRASTSTRVRWWGLAASTCAQWWPRSEEHTSELQSLMRTSYAVFCLKKKHTPIIPSTYHHQCPTAHHLQVISHKHSSPLHSTTSTHS